jgi:hypothetical protein
VKQRGRKSAESRAVLSLVDVSQYRPDPPSYLTEEQQEIWSEICSSMSLGPFHRVYGRCCAPTAFTHLVRASSPPSCARPM